MALKDLLPWRREQRFRAPVESMRELMQSMENAAFESLRMPARVLRGLGFGEARVDFKETTGAFIVAAELPGFEKEEIHVDVGESSVTIRVEQTRQTEEKRKHGASRQQTHRSWTQSFALPAEVKTAEARALFERGRLTVELPKVKESPVRRVEIE